MPLPQLQPLMDLLPAIGQVLLIAAGVAGLVLLLMGRKLARSFCAILGLLIGGVVAFAVTAQIAPGGGRLVWIVGGALVGCLAAWILFRVWMGATLAAVLALVVPLAVLYWQSQTPPVGQAMGKAAAAESRSAERDPAASLDLAARWRRAASDEGRNLRQWWQGLGSSGRNTLLMIATAGAVVGLVVGLIGPYLAASVESSLLASLLILLALRGLLSASSTSAVQWLPNGPKATLALLGLITATGVCLQWIISRRPADK